MEKTTDILNELISLSPLIAGIKKLNVFTVPSGYFESILTTILACIQEEQAGFNLPVDKQSRDVPEGYFDQLATSILEKIKSTEADADETIRLSPLLYSLRNNQVFDVPEGYFESLTGNIIDKTKTVSASEELSELSPLLYSIQNKAIFDVPGEYFTGLPGNVLRKLQPRPAKVISMPKRNFFIKYAVAAMLTGAIALGLYKYIEKPGSVPNDNSVATLDANIEKGKNMDDRQFNEAMENLTETDIAQYLAKNGDITDVAILGSNLEEANLPSQDDYLQDETTLENYLKEIEKITINN